jgi:16S rRNA (guanine527-N7)-methyltransferase
MKGTYPQDEVAALPAGWSVTGSQALRVPGLDAERHLLVVARTPA